MENTVNNSTYMTFISQSADSRKHDQVNCNNLKYINYFILELLLPIISDMFSKYTHKL